MQTTIDNVWSQGKIGQSGVYDVDAASQIATPVQVAPGGIFWDPFNCPDEIGELRAGKNSIDFTWKPDSADENKFFNLDVMACFSEWTCDGPYCGQGRPWTIKLTTQMDPAYASTYGLAEKTASANASNAQNIDYMDYTIPNMFNMPIAPTKWFWKEIQQSIGDWYPTESQNTPIPFWKKLDKYWPGTEWESFTHSPSQWFCKGIPLYDASNNPIKTTTQVSFQITLTLEGRKRRSAYFAPTHGPWSGDQLYYMSNRRGILQPACIRYRTGGRRRTWQNLQTRLKLGGSDATNVNTNNMKTHQRQDPFVWNPAATDMSQIEYNNGHFPTGIPDASNHNRILQPPFPNIKVTWSKETDSTEIIMEEEEPAPQPKSKTSHLAKLMHLK